MSTTPNDLIGNGIIFPLNINNQGTLQLDTGWDLLKSSIYNILAFIVGQRYFLGEFGASLEDMIEEPNDEISQTVIQHRLEVQLSYWDARINVDFVQINRDNDTNVTIAISVSLKGTDLSEIFIIPSTVFTVQ